MVLLNSAHPGYRALVQTFRMTYVKWSKAGRGDMMGEREGRKSSDK